MRWIFLRCFRTRKRWARWGIWSSSPTPTPSARCSCRGWALAPPASEEEWARDLHRWMIWSSSRQDKGSSPTSKAVSQTLKLGALRSATMDDITADGIFLLFFFWNISYRSLDWLLSSVVKIRASLTYSFIATVCTSPFSVSCPQPFSLFGQFSCLLFRVLTATEKKPSPLSATAYPRLRCRLPITDRIGRSSGQASQLEIPTRSERAPFAHFSFIGVLTETELSECHLLPFQLVIFCPI